MRRWIITIVLVAHGASHIQGILALYGIDDADSNERSWLLTDVLGDKATKAIGAVLWSAAVFGFVNAGLGALEAGPAAWRGLAAAAAVVSFVALLLYWNGLATIFSKIGAIGVNLIVLWGAFVADWPTEDWLG
jgi:hypothetical protein